MIAAVQPLTEIRSMQSLDLTVVAEIERDSYSFPWNYGIFHDCLLAGCDSLVLVTSGAIVGYGVMSVATGEAHLLNLCVHPSVQRLGYGRRLLSALLVRAEEAKVGEVFLEVRPSNQIALNLYRSAGFKQIGVRLSYYRADEGREDAVILSTTLHLTNR
ncbi:MAG: ribosomal protein S18-alanine N-acetyltransferase [Gammaproteobacteria bacterium]|nr:ribosomal-protein-alanine N-acetyltransferase [Alphaproteobacteria bacterium]